MSSTDLTTLDPARVAALAARVGADPSANRGTRVPQLKINMDDEDANKNVLPRGHMFITGQEEPVYAKSVNIRPLMQHFQYLHYDQAANKMVGRTIEVTSFSQELYDSLGGVRLGKPPSKVMKTLPEDVQKIIREVGRAYEDQAGASLNARQESGLKGLAEVGAQIKELSQEARAGWAQSLTSFPSQQAKDADGRGMPGSEVLNAYIKAVDDSGYEWPVRYTIE